MGNIIISEYIIDNLKFCKLNAFVSYDDTHYMMVTSFQLNISHQTVTGQPSLQSKQQMTAQKDQEDIANTLLGDMNAFSQLIDRHKNLVFTLSLQMLKNKEEAEEAAQDTFLKVYKSLKKFKGGSKFSTWLYRITYNTCLDRLKKNKRRQQTVAIDTVTIHKIQLLNTVLDTLEQQERKEIIQHCLQLLPASDSFLITLYYFEELSLEEMAAIVRYTPNTIKVKLFRCRKRLMAILQKKLEPELLESYESKNR